MTKKKPKRYMLLSRGDVRYVWDTKDEKMHMLHPDSGEYVSVESSLMTLTKQGYVEPEGETDTFPT